MPTVKLNKWGLTPAQMRHLRAAALPPKKAMQVLGLKGYRTICNGWRDLRLKVGVETQGELVLWAIRNRVYTANEMRPVHGPAPLLENIMQPSQRKYDHWEVS